MPCFTRRALAAQRGAGAAASKFTSTFAGDTPLIFAVRSGDINAVDAAYAPELLQATNNAGNTALHVAVENRFLAAVIYLLRKGADPNKLNDAGESPFHIAARTGNPDIIQHLVRHGALLSVKTRNDENVLNIAKAHERTNILHLLPKHPMPSGLILHLSPSSAANAASVPAGLFDRVADPINFSRTVDLLESYEICTGIDVWYQNEVLVGADYIMCAITPAGKPVGFATINIYTNELKIELFCSDYKYKGIGSFMMNKIKEFKMALALERIELNSVTNAREFYRKQGFVENASNTRRSLRKMTFKGAGGRGGSQRGLKSQTRRIHKWRL